MGRGWGEVGMPAHLGKGLPFGGAHRSPDLHPDLPMGFKSTLGCETTLGTTSSPPPCKVKAESWRGPWLGA